MSRLAAFGGRRAALWIAPLLLLLANVAWLVAFGSGAKLRADDLDRRLQRLRNEKARVSERLAGRERLWIVATENQQRIASLVGERLSTERARFTEMVRELKELAERSGLDPQTIGYPSETLSEYGLTRRSFVLPVEGRYGALRTFLNLIELSPSFLTVEQISVSASGSGLSVRLRLVTYFQSPGDPREPGS